MMNRYWIVIGAVIVGGTLIAWLGVRQSFGGPAAFTVRVGDPAPDFTLMDQSGNPVTLSEKRGHWVVLYFYPKDDTPGCTKEACSFRDNIISMQQLDAVVLGISVDTVASHKAFSEKYHLNFPILADNRKAVCRTYGILTSYLGLEVASRSTVIIDPQGVVRRLFPSVEPKDHALEIYKALKELKGA
jgi:peroxiredoxin Q/BCP